MNNRPITELDFTGIKNQLKDYLKAQDKFKGYDFEGSNMAVILDVLAYNTYQNNFYTNMAFSEMFLDSARDKNSIISHAKELNYLPRSAKAAKATINISINSDTPGNTILLPKGSRFSTKYAGSNYLFLTREAYLLSQVAGTTRFEAKCINIFQGTETTERFFIKGAIDGCTLSNVGIDSESISVSVVIDEITQAFTYVKDIFGINADDLVFYLQPASNDRYSVTFGRNVYGFQPGINQQIEIRYEINSGSAANGSSTFRSLDLPASLVTTVTVASGGAETETAENIKFFAPKSIQIQERAVTARDYEILLRQRFSEIQAISVYGGDELDPPRFGKVGISINTFGNNKLSETSKQLYLSYLSDKSPLSIQPIFIDPDFIYADLKVDVYYSRKLTSKSEEELKNIVKVAIMNFNDTNLNDFGVKLKFSNLSKVIDASDTGILNSVIAATPLIEYSPLRLVSQTPTFRFSAELVKPYPFQLGVGFESYVPAIRSSNFTYRNILSNLQDDGLGAIQVISADKNNVQIINANAGNVNYKTGTVNLVEFVVEDYIGSAINIFANTINKDIQAPKNRLLSINDANLQIKMIEDR